MFAFVQIALIPRFNSSLTFHRINFYSISYKFLSVSVSFLRFEASVEDNDDDDAYL